MTDLLVSQKLQRSRKKWYTVLKILVIWIYWTKNCTKKYKYLELVKGRIFNWNYVIFAVETFSSLFIICKLFLFQFKDFHVPLTTLQSIGFNFFAKVTRGNCIFCCSSYISSWQTFVLMKTSWGRLEDVFRLRLQKTSQDVLNKTNIFVLAIRLQDAFNTSSWRFQDSSSRLQDIFKTSYQDVFKTFSKHLQDVLQKRLQDIFKASSRRFEDVWHLQDIFKTSCKDVFKTFSRRIRLNCLLGQGFA